MNRNTKIFFGAILAVVLVGGFIFGAKQVLAADVSVITNFSFTNGKVYSADYDALPSSIPLYYATKATSSCQATNDVDDTVVTLSHNTSATTAAGGTMNVSPRETTVYTMTCVGTDGTTILTSSAAVVITKASQPGSATLRINVVTDPPASTPVDIDLGLDGQAILVTGGVATIPGLKVGTHILAFGLQDKVLINGVEYFVPQPKEGRRVGIDDADVGTTKEITVTYYQASYLKPVNRSEAESLMFIPNSTVASTQMYLVKGVASISVDRAHWQYSAAEVLSIGAGKPLITLTKSDNSAIIAASGGATPSTEYELSFTADNIADGFNTAITDTFTTDPASEVNEIFSIIITKRTITIGGVVNSNPATLTATPVLISGGRKGVDVNINGGVHGATYTVGIRIRLLASVDPMTKVINTAISDLNTSLAAVDEDIVTTAFLQETGGGGVFGRTAVNLRDPGSVLYVIGSGGNIQGKSTQDWTVGDYGISSNSASSFGISEGCPSTSACGIIQESVRKMKNDIGPTDPNNIKTSTINVTTLDVNPKNRPEGGVLLYSSSNFFGSALTLGDGNDSVDAPIDISGRGTIVVEGDLIIRDSIKYKSGSDMVGFIVHNGNVTVYPGVKTLSGIFFIYSDGAGASTKGSFRSLTSSPAYDSQLTINGVVIASGRVSATDPKVRLDAFLLSRNYIGPLSEFDDPTTEDVAEGWRKYSDPSTWEPSEKFIYDSRVVLNPPPGFAKEVFKARE